MSNTTKQQRDFFIACAIGDGHITKGGTLVINHCEQQKELVEYKILIYVCAVALVYGPAISAHSKHVFCDLVFEQGCIG